MNKNVLGLISVLVLVVMVSGCTSTMGNAQKDLNITVSKATFYVNNNSATIVGKIINSGSSAYSNINVEVLGIKNGKAIYNKTETVSYVAPNQNTGFVFVIPPQNTRLTNYKVTILNATAQ